MAGVQLHSPRESMLHAPSCRGFSADSLSCVAQVERLVPTASVQYAWSIRLCPLIRIFDGEVAHVVTKVVPTTMHTTLDATVGTTLETLEPLTSQIPHLHSDIKTHAVALSWVMYSMGQKARLNVLCWPFLTPTYEGIEIICHVIFQKAGSKPSDLVYFIPCSMSNLIARYKVCEQTRLLICPDPTSNAKILVHWMAFDTKICLALDTTLHKVDKKSEPRVLPAVNVLAAQGTPHLPVETIIYWVEMMVCLKPRETVMRCTLLCTQWRAYLKPHSATSERVNTRFMWNSSPLAVYCIRRVILVTTLGEGTPWPTVTIAEMTRNDARTSITLKTVLSPILPADLGGIEAMALTVSRRLDAAPSFLPLGTATWRVFEWERDSVFYTGDAITERMVDRTAFTATKAWVGAWGE
ncbi:hypothetical protein [Nocardia asiatica]|uniref:hypothetical protein n=1 Tax=Nocardia asiatica TaxID=209252 RepID=UPI0012F7E45E|nr:hypothetical protein [Nocardia asiatica]